MDFESLNIQLAKKIKERVGQKVIGVSGLWLRGNDKTVELLAEDPSTGEWVLLMDAPRDNITSHIYEPTGVQAKFEEAKQKEEAAKFYEEHYPPPGGFL